MTIAAEIQPRLVYITAASVSEAETIARDLLERRVIACANIIPTVHSLYRWEGKIETGEEALLLAKTVAARVQDVLWHVKTLHSYACPAIAVLPIEDADARFLSWLAESTTKTI